MRAAKLTSSAIERIAYDDDASTLSIWFKGSGLYLYFIVPPHLYQALKNAPSPGRFFCDSIKGRFPCRFDPRRRKFRPPAEPAPDELRKAFERS